MDNKNEERYPPSYVYNDYSIKKKMCISCGYLLFSLLVSLLILKLR